MRFKPAPIAFLIYIYISFSVVTAFSPLAQGRTSVDQFQRGAKWSDRLPSVEDLKNPVVLRSFQATMQLGSATGFYLGKFLGKHVVATNFHVVRRILDGSTMKTECCEDQLRIYWNSTGERARVVDLIGAWPEIDLALVMIESSSSDLEKYAMNFDFQTVPARGTKLGVMGYGSAGRDAIPVEMSLPYFSEDEDCQIVSETGEFSLMADPDIFNPAEYRAWSFAHECDTSPGNSGSMVFDIRTGSVYGLVWTGTVTYGSIWQITANGRQLIEVDNRNVALSDETIWTNYMYAVPAIKIKEVLQQKIATHQITGFKAEIIKSILDEGTSNETTN